MKLPRRKFLHLAAGAAALPFAPRVAWAQAYPSRPVRIIVGFPAGGAPDIFARLTGQWLSDRLGRQFVIENRPGAGSNLATEVVVRAPADGYTILLVSAANSISATLYDKLNFNFVCDITPVASIVRLPLVMLVHPSVSAKTVSEFIAYAKANPAKVNMASSGIGTSLHMTGELFKMMAGVDLVHVPYRGGAGMLTDLIGGQVHILFVSTETIEHIRSGKVRALAVTTATRSELLPDTPTLAEFLPGFEASIWQGIGVPKNTPPEIIERLNKEINLALADPKMKRRFADLGSIPFPTTPAEFGEFIASETEKWAKVIRAANIKAE